eukprot:4806828-Alexandrium_andersonii.AAC.1
MPSDASAPLGAPPAAGGCASSSGVGVPRVMPLPDKPSEAKPQNVRPNLVRGYQRGHPTCRGNKDRTPATIAVTHEWQAYEREYVAFEALTTYSANEARAIEAK